MNVKLKKKFFDNVCAISLSVAISDHKPCFCKLNSVSFREETILLVRIFSECVSFQITQTSIFSILLP